MSKIILDENQNPVDFLAERNEEIKKQLAETLELFNQREASNKNGKKRYGFMFSMQINNALNKYEKMSAEEFCELDADDIEYYWNSYYDLMCYYNIHFEIVPNKQGFLRYFGINARQYEELQRHSDEGIRSEMIFIEDALKGDAFRAGENGNSDAKAISVRLSARGTDGHSVVSAGEEMLATRVAEAATPLELQRKLQAILGRGETKLLK